MCYIRIGGEQAEYFALSVNAREHADSSDHWDANWLRCTAEIAAGAFRGCLDASLRTDELERFQQHLERLNQRFIGDAELTTMEGWLTLRLSSDGRGHVEANCRLCDDRAARNTLECRIALDQTCLNPLLQQLAEILRTYPVVHRQG